MTHSNKVAKLQEELKNFQTSHTISPLNFRYNTGHSNTTRSKSYKQTGGKLDLEAFNEIIKIDPHKRLALVEPRVTMEQLAKATLAYGLMPPVIPEFKGITVGGAIAGGAAESSSHKWGGFCDTCSALEVLCGDGTVLRTTPENHSDIFYGASGAYGSLGPILSAEIKLVPAKEFVRLHYHIFSNPLEALEMVQKLSHSTQPPDFIDAMAFAKNCSVVMGGTLFSKAEGQENLPCFSMRSASAEWYFQHVRDIARNRSSKSFEEVMTLQDYLFRYDQGAFWMGAYLFYLPLLTRFLTQGLLKISQPRQERFNQEEIEKFHRVPRPNIFWRTLMHRWLSSQSLWGLLHKAEKWVQDRVIIQDFCIPESQAFTFFQQILEDPATFPLWICPIQATKQPQIFAPHLLLPDSHETHFINFGIYGLSSYYTTIAQITRKLEKKTQELAGRKVLYSRSYYTNEEFWQIYSKKQYDNLRERTSAKGVWHEIADKLLSI